MRLTAASRGVTGVACAVAVLLIAGGCGRDQPERSSAAALISGGDEEAGRDAAIEHGCGSCHRIPGVPNANAMVGPPLDSWSERSFIAGTLPNGSENLGLFLSDPQAVRPGSAMPDLGLDDRDVADLVAFLFSLD